MASKRCSSRKKYANGTNKAGMSTSNYIPDPSEVMNDYNIMLAKAEQESLSDPLLPIISMAGGLLATALPGMQGIANKKPGVAAEVAAFGSSGVGKDVEIEGGEVIETPEGQVAEVKGPKHEEGGIPLEVGEDIPAGTKVYSERLKLAGKSLAQRKAIREKKQIALEKNLSKNTVDQAIKNSVERQLQGLEKEEEADLLFQEKVNSIQGAADNLVKAFGTGVEDIKKMAAGGTIEDPNFRFYNYDENGLPLMQFGPELPSLDRLVKASEATEKYINGEGKAGTAKLDNMITQASEPIEAPKTAISPTPVVDVQGSLGLEKNIFEAYPFTEPTENIPGLEKSIFETYPFTEPGKEGPVVPPTTAKQFGKPAQHYIPDEEEEVKDFKMPNIGVGDMTKLIGNYLGSTVGMKTAAEQRSTDVTHTNVYANAGKDALRYIDEAGSALRGQGEQAKRRATAISRGGKRSARGSSRGVNQMRATDWLYDNALTENISEISSNVSAQIAELSGKKASVSLSADELKGKGKQIADASNEAAKDAYYTALASGRKDMATGVQQTGKDLNAMKENEIITNLLKQYGKYLTVDAQGNLKNKTQE